MTTANATSDGHQDVYDCEATAKANEYLTHHLTNYRGLLYARPLTACPDSRSADASLHWKAGWYWRHPKQLARDAANWHGPFSSRKAAVQDRLAHAKRQGAPGIPAFK